MSLVHLFNHLQHWGIERQDEFVPDATVPLHQPLRPPLRRKSGPRPSGRYFVVVQESTVYLPLCWLSSVPVGRGASHAPHHGCDEGQQPAPWRLSVARASAASADVAPASALQQRSPRGQPWASR